MKHDENDARSKRRFSLYMQLAVGAAALLLALGSASFSRSAAASPASTSLLVVAHASVADQRLDDDDLRAAFLRKRLSWSDGKRMIPLNYSAGHPLRVVFDQVVLGFSVDQAARYWIDARIRYGAQPPLALEGSQTLVRVASQLPGSLSYIAVGPLPAGLRAIARIEGGRVLAP
jgi:hypothetical protein